MLTYFSLASSYKKERKEKKLSVSSSLYTVRRSSQHTWSFAKECTGLFGWLRSLLLFNPEINTVSWFTVSKRLKNWLMLVQEQHFAKAGSIVGWMLFSRHLEHLRPRHFHTSFFGPSRFSFLIAIVVLKWLNMLIICGGYRRHAWMENDNSSFWRNGPKQVEEKVWILQKDPKKT